MKLIKTIPTTQFVTFQKNVIVHLFRGVMTDCRMNKNYICSHTMTYKDFFELDCTEFYFKNECKDTLQRRLNKIKKAGFTITENDHVSYKYKAVKK